MSTEPHRVARPAQRQPSAPPFIGALLRLCWQRVRNRIGEAIRADGFTDLQEAHLVIFQYPLPDGVRPSVLARQRRISRQAANYLIAQLEDLGYLQRRAASDGGRRLVYLTARGHRVVDTIYACSQQLQEEWAGKIGGARYDVLMATLRELAAEGDDPAEADPVSTA